MDTQLQTVWADATTIINYQQFEEIFIKEEPQETTSQDNELNENVLLNVKKEEQSDKDYDIPITENNRIRKTENVNSNRFCCGVCSKRFRRKYHLIRHLKAHSGIKEYECDECKKLFAEKSKLKRHMKGHAGIKDFSCSMCNKSFSQKFTLFIHMKYHTGTKDYHCSVCGKSFVEKSTLRKHWKIHSGDNILP